MLDMTDKLRRDAYDGIVDRAQFRRFGLRLGECVGSIRSADR